MGINNPFGNHAYTADDIYEGRNHGQTYMFMFNLRLRKSLDLPSVLLISKFWRSTISITNRFTLLCPPYTIENL